MASKPHLLGGRIRALRRQAGKTQIQLAALLEISPSYLNLIEHDRRPLTAALLLRLARHLEIDLRSFALEDDAQLVKDLTGALADPLFDDLDVTMTELHEAISVAPTLARAILLLYEAYRSVHESAESLSSRLSDDLALPGVERSRLPSVEVTDLIQHHGNYFPELETLAEEIWSHANLRLDDLWHGMVSCLEEVHGVGVRIIKASEDGGAVRRYDPRAKCLFLSDSLPLPSQKFQTAFQIGLLSHAEPLSRFSRDKRLTTAESRSLSKVAMTNYFAGAMLMPYAIFIEAAEEARYDIELLQNRFGASFEQVCHRLTTLGRKGAEGIPFFFVRSDIAGNLSKWFSSTDLQFPRFGGSCARWIVHRAFLTPGRIVTQLARRPDGNTYFSLSRTVERGARGYHLPAVAHAVTLGCEVTHARKLVYADDTDLAHPESAIPVGTTCRLCDVFDCEQRAFSPIHHPFKVDESARGVSFYQKL